LFAFPMWWTVTWTITKFFILGGSKIDNIPFYYQPRLGEGVWFLTCYMKFQFWHLKLLERISIPNIFSDHKKSCKILVTANFCRSLNTGHGTSSWDLVMGPDPLSIFLSQSPLNNFKTTILNIESGAKEWQCCL
jgi:hypothetical protein